jgi:hypothetical protein
MKKNIEDVLDSLSQKLNGKVDNFGTLPDGSGFATMSLPLPKDHWIYKKEDDDYDAPPMHFRMGIARPMRKEFENAILKAGRWAVKASTLHGKNNDFDPDALVKNIIIGLIGYYTEDGLSDSDFANPNPVPPIYDDK